MSRPEHSKTLRHREKLRANGESLGGGSFQNYILIYLKNTNNKIFFLSSARSWCYISSR